MAAGERRAQIRCARVVAALDLVLITMSPWRERNPFQRALSWFADP
jgi:hypothetical protein